MSGGHLAGACNIYVGTYQTCLQKFFGGMYVRYNFQVRKLVAYMTCSSCEAGAMMNTCAIGVCMLDGAN